jgi:hypothetical protein
LRFKPAIESSSLKPANLCEKPKINLSICRKDKVPFILEIATRAVGRYAKEASLS